MVEGCLGEVPGCWVQLERLGIKVAFSGPTQNPKLTGIQCLTDSRASITSQHPWYLFAYTSAS